MFVLHTDLQIQSQRRMGSDNNNAFIFTWYNRNRQLSSSSAADVS
jgi:hypothetical protein